MVTIKRNKRLNWRIVAFTTVALLFSSKSAIKNFQSGEDGGMIAAFILVLVATVMLVFAVTNALELLRSKAALTISDEGIMDNVSSTQAGLIKWNHIDQVSIKNIRNRELLVIGLVEGYTPPLNSPIFKHAIARKEQKEHGNSIVIHPNFVVDTLEDILRAIEEGRPQKPE
ncbi:MAG: STM3941 family protein [Bacteroidota bacterium]